MGRKFVRMSLGGIHDEAEIRGHRRTYIGALPGRVIQGIKTAGIEQPGVHARRDRQGRHGLPRRPVVGAAGGARSGAEQHLPGQLPGGAVRPVKVLFIATANMLDTIPPALRDRMEIIQLPGYTQQEKLRIAQRFLMPKQLENHGLTAEAAGHHRRRHGRA